MTPCEALICAIIEQAVHDALHPAPAEYGGTTLHDQHEAREFLTATGGRWARSRRDLCEAIGMDPEILRKRITLLIDRPDERPNPTPHRTENTMSRVLRAVVAGIETPKAIACHLGIGEDTVRNGLYELERRGEIVRTYQGGKGRGSSRFATLKAAA